MRSQLGCSKYVLIVILVLNWISLASASPTPQVDPFYAASYTLTDLGSPPGLPGGIGGLALKPGDPNTLLVGGDTISPIAAIYAFPVSRGPDNHITGFGGPSTLFASAPWADTFAFGPNGVLFYSTYIFSSIGQIKPGSIAPDKVLTAAIFNFSDGLNFVPPGFPGANQLIFNSYDESDWYQASLSPDGSGTFNIDNTTETVSGIHDAIQGFVYIKHGNPLFSGDTMLVLENGAVQIGAFDIDSDGNPILSTRRTFVSGVEGGEGAVIDPLTGDLLFSKWGGGNEVYRVTGFGVTDFVGPATVPEPSTWLLLGSGLVGLGLWGRKRRREVQA